MAVEAVFSSWNGRRAVDYRTAAKIPHDLGTAVNVQAMVFGNLGDRSATGVAMTRSGATGEPGLEGDFLINAQGEDVVSGTRATRPIQDLAPVLPEAYAQLRETAAKLEMRYRDMQDIEFTVEDGRLWLLQTRDGKRTAAAAVRIAVDLASEELITRADAVRRVSRAGRLLPAPAAVRGGPPAAEQSRTAARHRPERLPRRGGRHRRVRPRHRAAARRRRSRGDPAAAGDQARRRARDARRPGHRDHPRRPHQPRRPGGPPVRQARRGRGSRAWRSTRSAAGPPSATRSSRRATGSPSTAAPATSTVGRLETFVPDLTDAWLARLLSWADDVPAPRGPGQRRQPGRRHAGPAQRRRRYRSVPHRAHVLRTRPSSADAEDDHERQLRRRRREALAALEPLQRSDFLGLFQAMDGLPVIIRLVDPPLHEFLPTSDELARRITDAKIRLSVGRVAGRDRRSPRPAPRRRGPVLRRVQALRESNPMLGLRGVRLALRYPEILQMQVRAIFHAACDAYEAGGTSRPEIMVPLTTDVGELIKAREVVDAPGRPQCSPNGTCTIPYQVGTMVETPRAALTAVTVGRACRLLLDRLQRPDPNHLRAEPRRRRDRLPARLPTHGIYDHDPFTSIDPDGVGRSDRPVGRARPERRGRVRGRRLRRARGRSNLDHLVPPARTDLRQLLPTARTGGPTGSRASGPGQRRRIVRTRLNPG